MTYSDPTLNLARPDWLPQVTSDLFRQEGFREYPYPDPLSDIERMYPASKYKWGYVPADQLVAKLGLDPSDGDPWTIGVGFTGGNVTLSSRMSKEQAAQKLTGVILTHAKLLDTLVPTWKDMPLYVKTVLVNLAYNMGNRLAQFGPTLALFTQHNYQAAASHLRASLWFKQTGSRARELVGRLENGRIEPEHLINA